MNQTTTADGRERGLQAKRFRRAAIVLGAIRRNSMPCKAFARPLRIGDPDQVGVMRILNGARPYCGKCLREFEPDDLIEAFGMDVDVEAVGEPCPVCHGLILPGAGMTARWMRYAGLAAGTACAM